ncbi:MAG: integration host factor, actinobacterial type [Actinomycetota bacterium]|nr:integration host factor, actinobacterial type [Actinomycetota bacterium]
MAPVPPSLTQEQRVAASRAAVANRRRRAEVKKLVKAGDLSLEELFALAEKEECVAQMRAYDLISALPAIGEVKAARIMKNAAIAQTRRIRGLGPRQREQLFQALVR